MLASYGYDSHTANRFKTLNVSLMEIKREHLVLIANGLRLAGLEENVLYHVV